MSESLGDKVTFLGIPGAYKTGEHVLLRYEVETNFETNSRDWIGVFCVGWTSNRDYYTFEWVPSSKNSEEEKTVYQIKFSGSRLPPEDGHFYQFCYVTRNGVVKGASRPFQFTKTISGDSMGDLDDLVEVNEEDSLLFLRTRHETQLAELQKKVDQLTAVNENVEATVVIVKSDCDDQKQKCEKAIAELQASQHEVANLKNAIETKEELIQKMKETLEVNEEKFDTSQKEVGLLQATVVNKEEETQASKLVVEKLSRKVEDLTQLLQETQAEKDNREKQLQELGDQITLLVDENKVLLTNEQSLRDKCNQLEQDNRGLLENKEVLESRLQYKESEAKDLTEHVEVLKSQVISLEEEMDEMANEIEQERKDKKKLAETIRIKEQEVNLAQENLCEVMGKVKEPRDLLDRQTSVENVDKSALEALQLAYSDVEKRWNLERKSVVRLKNKVAEMECRIKKCCEEFEAKAKENVDLRKELKKAATSSITTGGKPDGESEATILLLQREYERLELELQEFQLKHDQRIDEKNTRIDQLEVELDQKVKELEGRQAQEEAMKKTIEALKIQNDQLATANAELNYKAEREKSGNRQHHHHQRGQHPKEQLVTPPYNPGYYGPGCSPNDTGYRPSGGYLPSSQPKYPPHPSRPSRLSDNPRKCPICQTSFPNSMPLKDFERHVNTHLH